MTDTIKCRLNKAQLGQVPIEIINNCATRFLREESKYIQPKTIILLNDTTRRGLAQLKEFEQLDELRIKKDCGKTLELDDYRIVLHAYHSIRNGHILREHPLSQLLKS